MQATSNNRQVIVHNAWMRPVVHQRRFGMCQGCPLSPFLFAILLTVLIHRAVLGFRTTSLRVPARIARADVTNLQSARRSELPVQEAAGGIRVLTQANAGSKQFHVAALLGCRFCRRCNACRLCANRVAIREIEMVFAMHPLMTPFSVVHQSRLPRVRIGPLRTS